MNNLVTRAIAGAVYVTLIVACILLGIDCFWILLSAFTVIAFVELQNLFKAESRIIPGVRILDIVVALIVLFAVRCFSVGIHDSVIIHSLVNLAGILFFAVVLFYIPARIVFAVCDRSDRPLRAVFCSLLSIFYILFPISLLLLAYGLKNGPEIVLATFIFIWVNDTGAYLSGITLGKHRLCERLSPKKSWEGFFGGFILTLIAGFITSLITGIFSHIAWIIYAAFVSVLSTYGDLFESLIKRTFGVKDSGTLIPGHGGILDRIDSLLAVAYITVIFAALSNGV